MHLSIQIKDTIICMQNMNTKQPKSFLFPDSNFPFSWKIGRYTFNYYMQNNSYQFQDLKLAFRIYRLKFTFI